MYLTYIEIFCQKQLISCISEKDWSSLSLGDDVGMKKSTSGKLAEIWFAAWFAPIRLIGEYWFGIGLILLRLSLGWTTRNLKNQFEIVLRLFSLLNLYFDADSTQIFSSKYSKYRLSNPNYPFPNEQPIFCQGFFRTSVLENSINLDLDLEMRFLRIQPKYRWIYNHENKIESVVMSQCKNISNKLEMTSKMNRCIAPHVDFAFQNFQNDS